MKKVVVNNNQDGDLAQNNNNDNIPVKPNIYLILTSRKVSPSLKNRLTPPTITKKTKMIKLVQKRGREGEEKV